MVPKVDRVAHFERVLAGGQTFRVETYVGGSVKITMIPPIKQKNGVPVSITLEDARWLCQSVSRGQIEGIKARVKPKQPLTGTP